MLKSFTIATLLVITFHSSIASSNVPKQQIMCSPTTTDSKFCRKLIKYAEHKKLEVHPDEVREIAQHIEVYSRYTRLNKWDIAAINIREARLNRLAYNKRDGGFGLGQITNYDKDWKEIMPFLRYKRYGIHEGVLATCIAINVKANDIKSQKRMAIIRAYNSQSYNGTLYAQKIDRISTELKKI